MGRPDPTFWTLMEISPAVMPKNILLVLSWSILKLYRAFRQWTITSHIYNIYRGIYRIQDNFIFDYWLFSDHIDRYSRNLPVCDPRKIWGVVNIVISVIQRRFGSRWGKSETQRVLYWASILIMLHHGQYQNLYSPAVVSPKGIPMNWLILLWDHWVFSQLPWSLPEMGMWLILDD